MDSSDALAMLIGVTDRRTGTAAGEAVMAMHLGWQCCRWCACLGQRPALPDLLLQACCCCWAVQEAAL